MENLPVTGLPEIAFVGRSNAGKSTAINTLCQQRQLAFASKTPGRTQHINFFAVGPKDSPSGLLVDLPGYGYAAAAKSKVAAWTRLIHAYLNGRATLARVYVLIDARHGLKAVDEIILDTLGQAAVSYEIVLTKSDQVTAAKLAECRRTTLDSIHNRPAAFPDIVATSAHTGDGIPTLRAAIGRLIREREHIAGRGSDPGRRVPSCR